VTGRERHVDAAREGNKPYPQRALRTKEFLYIRNFAPDRYPLGDPKQVTADKAPAASVLENNTLVAFADMDASPTKAWLIAHRNDKEWKRYYDLAFGKRPAEELYDLRSDPDQGKNVAGDKAYEATRKQLLERLTKILTEAGDPRLVEPSCRFEKPPFADAAPEKK
jgi:N-sulfoglucosamine sulfohydrolase